MRGLCTKGGDISGTGNAWAAFADAGDAAVKASPEEVVVFFGCEVGGAMALAVLLAPIPEVLVAALPCAFRGRSMGKGLGSKPNAKPGTTFV